MKILILGANGNLGGQLIKAFSTEENNVTAWGRQEIDVTDKQLIMKKVGDLKPDLIINTAAYNAVDKCESDEAESELAKKLNIDAPGYIAEAALKFKATFIHFSTNYVFAGKKRDGYVESDETGPINQYGKTKLGGERSIIQLSGKGLKWYILRTSKLFGPKGESEFSKPSFFDIMLKLSKEKEQLDVVNEEVSCFTYTPDLAKAVKELADGDYGYGIYHFANEFACTWYKAANELFDMAGIKIKVNPIKGAQLQRAAKRPKYSALINTKFPKFRDWREALKEYLAESKV